MNDRTWRREQDGRCYIICTRPDLLDYGFINTAFASDEMDWATPLPADQMATMLSQSITLGLYEVLPSAPSASSVSEPSSPRTPSPTLDDSLQEQLKQIGMARLITDRITTAFLTDVYVLPDFRKGGLAKWLIACCKDLMAAYPAMRRILLFATGDAGKAFYARELGMWDVRDEEGSKVVMTRKMYK